MGNMTLQEKNKEIIRRYNEEILNKQNLDRISEFVSPDFINHSSPPGLPNGPENIRIQMANVILPAFPDFRVEILDQIADGDKVVSRKSIFATHSGTFMGIPASHKKVELKLIEIMRLLDGKFVEHWNVQDLYGLVKQISV